jgi:Resolvase, N terminal domain
VDYVDHGVSGSKDRRPALDRLVKDAKRRKFDVLVTWKLDRLGRNLKHLITLLEDLQALGVAFVSLNEGIDATTPAGKLQMHILGAIAGSNVAESSSACGRAGAGEGAGETPGPAAVPDYRCAVRDGCGLLAPRCRPGARRQPCGRASVAAVT